MRATELGRTASRLSPVALAFLVLALMLGTAGGAVAGKMITGKQIKNGTITSADIKNNSLKGKDVRNGSLNGADIADEARLYGARVDDFTDDFTSSAWTPVVGKTITTPAGHLAVNATLYAEDDFTLAGTGFLDYRLRIDGKLADDASRHFNFDTNGDGETGAVTALVPVSAGNHVVEIVVREIGSGSFLYGGEWTATWTASADATGFAFVGRPRVGRAQLN